MKICKFYSFKSQPKAFKLVLNFLPNGPHKTTLEFFSKFSNSLLYPMEKSKTSIIWKTNVIEQKGVNFGTQGVLVQHIWGTFGLVF